MLFSVDRIIGDKVVLVGEDEKTLDVPRSMLPQNARSGDMFRYKDGMFLPAPMEAAERRERMSDMLRFLLSEEDD